MARPAAIDRRLHSLTWGYITRIRLAPPGSSRHTCSVSRPLSAASAARSAAIALSLLSGTAASRPARSTDDPPPVVESDFWRDLLEPHADVVDAMLARAQRVLDTEPAHEAPADLARQQRRLDDAYGMLCRARALSPEHPDVLRLLGIVADQLGKTGEALDAFEHAARLDTPDRINPDVADRLGVLYMKLGKLDDAVRWLHRAQASRAHGDRAAATVHLAAALAARGDLGGAIDLLVGVQPPPSGLMSEDRVLTAFALAVYYDREEQPGAAFSVLDRLQVSLQQEMSPLVQRLLAGVGFAPAEDEYYYLAMLHEATGAFIEARAQWAMYAAIPTAAWRGRALDHIAAIDAQRRATPPATATTKPPPTQVP